MKHLYFGLSIFLLLITIFLFTEGFDVKSDDTINSAGLSVNNFNVLPPTGTIVSYLGDNDPDGWVICDGGGRPDHGKYTSLIIMKIGERRNGKYFPPDLRGRFLRGQDAIRQMGGNERVALSIAHMPSHSHGGNTGWMNQNAGHNHGGTGNNNQNHTHGTYDGGVGNVAYTKYGVGHTATAADQGNEWMEPAITFYDGRGGSMYNDLNTRGQSNEHNHNIPWQDINHYHAIPAEGSGADFDITPYYYGVRYIVKYS